MQLGQVRGQGHIVELAAVEPGVQPPERAGIGAAGVRADGGLDQPVRGRRRAADRDLVGVDPGGPIIHVINRVICCLTFIQVISGLISSYFGMLRAYRTCVTVIKLEISILTRAVPLVSAPRRRLRVLLPAASWFVRGAMPIVQVERVKIHSNGRENRHRNKPIEPCRDGPYGRTHRPG